MARKSGPITTEQLTVVPANEASWDNPRHMFFVDVRSCREAFHWRRGETFDGIGL
jgi:hypothetical protein